MANDTRDIEAFTRQIETLKIELSKSDDGVLTACSSSEPLFCYDADTAEQIAELVADTVESYARHFFNIDGLKVSTESLPINQGTITIERGTPVATLKPHFDLAA